MQRDTLSTFKHAHFTIVVLETERIEFFHIHFFSPSYVFRGRNLIESDVYCIINQGTEQDLQQFIIKDSFNVNLFLPLYFP